VDHPLDRPVWSALTTRQKPLARGDARALQMSPEYGPFAAAADGSEDCQAALAALHCGDDGVWLVEPEEAPEPPGMTASTRARCVQMTTHGVTAGEAAFPVTALGDSDGPQMLALARLTRPGPFAARTHLLGPFVGVKQDGRLIAMAGERMKPDGFTEVSGVCTRPDHRGRGYAQGLMRIVARRILARGETPFLHVYETNTGAIRLYESLGFQVRRTVVLTVLRR
jgi:predicted GNAT family acetyltransferase